MTLNERRPAGDSCGRAPGRQAMRQYQRTPPPPVTVAASMIRTFLFTASCLWLAAMFLPALLMLLIPGRKGTMRTRREVVHDGITVADACELYARRLEHDGFAVDRSGAPALVKARRASNYHKSADGADIVTHATKAASVEVRLSPAA